MKMIASSDDMHFSKIRVENILLLTTKQGLHKYENKNSCRAAYMPTYLHVNAYNLCTFKEIPFLLSQNISSMYIQKSCKFHQILSSLARAITKFYDLLGQPSYIYMCVYVCVRSNIETCNNQCVSAFLSHCIG